MIYFGGDKYNIFDPLCTILFSIIVIFTTIPLLRESMRVLMEGVPKIIDTEMLK